MLIICLLNLLIGAIIYLIVRKKGKLGLLHLSRGERRPIKLSLIDWCIFFASFGAIAIGRLAG